MTHDELTELLTHIKALFDAQTPDIIKGIDEMLNAQTSGIQKDIRLTIDRVSAISTRMDNIGKDLAEIKEDTAVIREAVTNQDSVFFQVRRLDS